MTPLPAAEDHAGETAGRNQPIEADAPAEAILTSLKLNGFDRIWFVSGSEIGVLRRAP